MTAAGRSLIVSSAAATLSRQNRLHARWDLDLEQLPTDEVCLYRPAASDDVCIVHAKTLADQEERGWAGRIDALSAIPADKLRRKIGDAGVKEFKAPRGVFIGDRGLHSLQRELAIECGDLPLHAGRITVAVAGGAAEIFC